MKPIEQYEQDLSSIRTIMERSVKFISLSGLSGILAGIYALIGSAAAYALIQYPLSITSYRQESVQPPSVIIKLIGIALVVLAASLLTGFWLSYRKANVHGTRVWNETSKRLVINLSIPLLTGGIFILILLSNGHYGVVAPACLIFYGLALINASANLYEEVRYLGYSEIVLGLICAALQGYGLLFWAIGFGVLHIFYGALMYHKYDR
ncbi:MAG: hypothetical protein L0Y35_05400 [Flammeovirgaceae bacterium]|nr:hypothetical protein [Flammeovirgaceae bacterium]